MKFVLTGGGTGGHVYPALSVAAALTRIAPESELLYLGTASGAEQRLVPQHGLPFRPLHAGQVRGKAPWQTVASLFQLTRGVMEARTALASFQPHTVFATGGYASIPVVLAARLARIPVTVFLPDVYPGWAVRAEARLAERVATSTEGALAYLPAGKSTVTGYPLRPEFWQAERQRARSQLEFEGGPVLLVSGASLGSRALNNAVLGSLPELLELSEVLHLTGSADEARVVEARAKLPERLRRRYRVVGYLDDMAAAMAAADLAVMRAGASCLAEPAAAGLPAILMPGTFSDQRRNAQFMASEGAAVILDESRPSDLLPIVRRLLNSAEELSAMQRCARRLARPSAAETLARILLRAGRVEDLSEACIL